MSFTGWCILILQLMVAILQLLDAYLQMVA
ncbi:hypothetical protein [uncultured Leclercia sp.]|nr:hypothetical protein [uncultured Leclercia sp.]